jgi:hypothetical protein
MSGMGHRREGNPDLRKGILARKQGLARKKLGHNAPDTPEVDQLPVLVTTDNLGGSVPTRHHILCQILLLRFLHLG